MVELRKITKENFEKVIRLSVAENQIPFVASNVYSLAQAGIYRETAYPFAIYTDDILVGFIMMGYYEKECQYTLWRFMIDEKYQNKGYGKSALKLAVNYMIDNFKVKELGTGTHCKNFVAKKLYKSLGFKETDEIDGDQIGMKLLIKDFVFNQQL